ncbi:MAG: HD domain-containing protein [Gemmataceae bacterium]
MSTRWPKVFRDPVHNLISFEDTLADRLLLKLINTREVQRLRRIKQMGTTELVFPGANHSRFAHSLGVLHTARLFLDQFGRAAGRPIHPEQRGFLLAAALLHDVGHGPFSHAFELVTGRRHERFTQAILEDDSTEVNRVLADFDGTLPGRLSRFFAPEGDPDGVPAYLAAVVSGQLDADRCDYLLRDSHATGTNYGDYDLAWMIAQLRPDPAGRRFYLTHKGLSAVETYLFARFHMYRTVYFHKASRAAEVMLKLVFRRIKELLGAGDTVKNVSPAVLKAFTGQISLASYLDFDDHTVTELLKGCARCDDYTLRRLGDGLLNRKLYKCVEITGRLPSLEPSRLAAFLARAREQLGEIGSFEYCYEPAYCFVEDSASDTPYQPYLPDEAEPSRQIWVESAAGKVVEVSQLSEALLQLGRPYTMVRYYVPPALRYQVTRIADETLMNFDDQNR